LSAPLTATGVPLPSRRDFLRDWLALMLGLSGPTIALISLYLYSLLQLSAAQWVFFAQLVGGFFVVLFVAIHFVYRPLLAPVLSYLREAERPGREPDPEPAFRAVARMPVHQGTTALVFWALGGLLVGGGMWLRFEDFGFFRMVIMVVAATTGGFVSSAFFFFLQKRRLRSLHRALARRVGDPERRAVLRTRTPIGRKVFACVTGMAVATALYAMLLAQEQSGRTLEAFVSERQAGYLEEVLERWDGSEESLADAQRRVRRLGLARELAWLDAEGSLVWGSLGEVRERELDLALATPDGDSRAFVSPNVFSWRALPAGQGWLVASVPWKAVGGGAGRSWWIFGALVLGVAAVGYFLAAMLANDTGSAVAELQEMADRVGDGDLRAVQLIEHDDELGDLALAWGRMAQALRGAVGHVVGAADRVEGAASEMSSASGSMAEGAAAQGRGVGEASSSVDRVTDRMNEIARSAQDLNGLVEESSSSILEMGAASDELSDTAGVLSAKVEEVSASIDQTARSLVDVRANARSLHEAAEETSVRMEEMASSMRAVDTAAGHASELSQNVVEAALSGQARVAETIEGMRRIRETTDGVQDVIGRLGGRAHEIGAIVDVIDDVGDETNLLALNASIIAAQSGESGRAFAVVADEIRELADRVLLSTREIDQLIRSVQAEAGEAVEAIREGSQLVDEGVERSNDAGASLEEITRASRASGERIDEIVKAVREQTRAASLVAERMESVRQGVDAILLAAEEQARAQEVVQASSNAMRDVARQVKGTTEEQSRGSLRIRESIDGVRQAMDDINEALRSQASACEEVARFLEAVAGSTRDNEGAAGRMAGATETLSAQAQGLRRDVHRFRL